MNRFDARYEDAVAQRGRGGRRRRGAHGRGEGRGYQGNTLRRGFESGSSSGDGDNLGSRYSRDEREVANFTITLNFGSDQEQSERRAEGTAHAEMRRNRAVRFDREQRRQRTQFEDRTAQKNSPDYGRMASNDRVDDGGSRRTSRQNESLDQGRGPWPHRRSAPSTRAPTIDELGHDQMAAKSLVRARTESVRQEVLEISSTTGSLSHSEAVTPAHTQPPKHRRERSIMDRIKRPSKDPALPINLGSEWDLAVGSSAPGSEAMTNSEPATDAKEDWDGWSEPDEANESLTSEQLEEANVTSGRSSPSTESCEPLAPSALVSPSTNGDARPLEETPSTEAVARAREEETETIPVAPIPIPDHLINGPAQVLLSHAFTDARLQSPAGQVSVTSQAVAIANFIMATLASQSLPCFPPPMHELPLPDPTPVYSQARMALPVFSHRTNILESLYVNQVTVICGDTGSGKTTQVPQFILESALQRGERCKIICTQPRRLAATSVARRVAEERGEALGQVVGYRIGMERTTGSETKLEYVTTGILKQLLVARRSLTQWTHIVLDEVHERDLDSDFVMLIIKQLLEQAPHVRLVVMSATLDSDLFAAYFALRRSPTHPNTNLLCGSADARWGQPAPVLRVGGKCHPVEIHFLENIIDLLRAPELNISAGLLDECVSSQQEIDGPAIDPVFYRLAVFLVQAIDRWARTDNGSVLVFLPGFGEIQELFETFSRTLGDGHPFWLLPLHSGATSEEQERIFQPAPCGQRKVILATNIAESSITVPDVKYVVDFGFIKEIFYDAKTNLESLQLQWTSKASANQRAGRAGRVSPGVVYRLYRKTFWDEEMNSFAPPEMQRCPLESVVLQVFLLGLGTPHTLLSKALQPPQLHAIDTAVRLLQDAGALTAGGAVTYLGKLYALLPVDIRISRLILLGHIFGCSWEAIVMGAACSMRSIFTRPFNVGVEAHLHRMHWARGSQSDMLAALYAYEEWLQLKRSGALRSQHRQFQWGRDKFLHVRTLRDMDVLIEELCRRLESAGIRSSGPAQGNENDKLVLLKAILAGAFYPNFLRSSPDDPQELGRAEQLARDRSSSFNLRNTAALNLLPEGTRESDITSLLGSCGRMTQVIVTNGHAWAEFSEGGIKIPHEFACPVSLLLALRLRWSRLSISIPGRGESKPISGPFNAFTVGWHTLHTSKRVIVEKDSINSIVLTKDSSSRPRYLIGCFIYQNPHNLCLYARETTLLPDVPLFAAILAMLFSPAGLELRTNRRNTKYLGALVGNAMEFTFDAHFSGKDFLAINEMRGLISAALTEEGIRKPNTKELREKLLSLINATRPAMHPRERPPTHAWKSQSFNAVAKTSTNASTEDAWETPTLSVTADSWLSNPSTTVDSEPEQGPLLVLPPLVLPEPLILDQTSKRGASAADDEVDSDAEERAARQEVVRKLHAQIQVDTGSNADRKPPKEVLCATCLAALCPVSGLIRLDIRQMRDLQINRKRQRTTESKQDPADQEEGAVFELTKCFGQAFVEADLNTESEASDGSQRVICSNRHVVGFCASTGMKLVDATSAIVVTSYDGSDIIPWTPGLWRSNFAMIGGPDRPPSTPTSTSTSNSSSYRSPVGGRNARNAVQDGVGNGRGGDGRGGGERFRCELCRFECRTRRSMAQHLASRRHREEEEFFLHRSA